MQQEKCLDEPQDEINCLGELDKRALDELEWHCSWLATSCGVAREGPESHGPYNVNEGPSAEELKGGLKAPKRSLKRMLGEEECSGDSESEADSDSDCSVGSNATRKKKSP